MTRNLSTAALQGLRDRIAGLQAPAFRERVAKLCGAAALKLVADEFRGSHAPDGTPWAPLASRKGKALMKTGRLRSSFATEPSSDGFRIQTVVAYAGYHQDGTDAHERAARTQKFRYTKSGQLRFARNDRSGYLMRLRAHRNGGIPARPMLPTRGQLPDSWKAAFDKALSAAVRQQVTGRGA